MMPDKRNTPADIPIVEEHNPLIEELVKKRQTIIGDLKEVDVELTKLQQQLKQQIEEFREKRRVLEMGLQHVDALLRLEGWAGQSEEVGALGTDQRRSPGDAALRLLKESGDPMHYRDIASALLAQGIPLSGSNPHATLLAYLVRDQRFKRSAKRGIYGLSEWKFKAGRTRRRKKKGRR